MFKSNAQTLATGAVETLMAQTHAPLILPNQPDIRPAERLSADGQNPPSGTPPDPKSAAQLQKARKEKFDQLAGIQAKNAKGEELSDDEITQAETLATELEAIDKQIETLAAQVNQQTAQAQQAAAARQQRLAALGTRTETLAAAGRNAPVFTMHSGVFVAPANEERLEIGRYSLLRAVHMRHNRMPLDGIEHEVSREIERLYHKGKEPEGFYMPLGLPVQLAGRRIPTRMSMEQLMLQVPLDPEYLATDVAAGAGVVTAIQSPTIIELLRAMMLLPRLGVTMLTGLNEPVKIPKIVAGNAASWYEEGTSSEGLTDLDIDSVTLSPKFLRSRTQFTRSLTKQSGNVSIEMLCRNDQALALAQGFDAAAFVGSGSSGQPLGAFNNSNIPVVAINTNGGNMTWAKAVEFQTKVAVANARAETMSYVTNPLVVGHCMSTPKVANQPVYIIGENGTMAGKPVHSSTVIPSNLSKGSASGTLSGLIYGDWSTVIVGQYGGAIDVIVDPYTNAKNGGITVTSLMEGDIAYRHDTALAKCVDVLPT